MLLSGNITGYAEQPAYGETFGGPAARAALYNSSHASFQFTEEVFKNISQGITTNLRQYGNRTSGYYFSTGSVIDETFTQPIICLTVPALR